MSTHRTAAPLAAPVDPARAGTALPATATCANACAACAPERDGFRTVFVAHPDGAVAPEWDACACEGMWCWGCEHGAPCVVDGCVRSVRLSPMDRKRLCALYGAEAIAEAERIRRTGSSYATQCAARVLDHATYAGYSCDGLREAIEELRRL